MSGVDLISMDMGDDPLSVTPTQTSDTTSETAAAAEPEETSTTSTTTTTTTSTTTTSTVEEGDEATEEQIKLVVSGDDGDSGVASGAVPEIPVRRRGTLGRLWNEAEKHPRKLYCGLCWGIVAIVLLVSIIVIALPGTGTRVKFDEFTARVEYEIVEGRPYDMMLAVSKDGSYAAWIYGVTRTGSLETGEIHDSGADITLVEKVFDRYICNKVTLSQQSGMILDNLSPEWLLEESDIPCPAGSSVNESDRCEQWRRTTYVGNGFFEALFILDKKTKYPLVLKQSLADSKVTLRFKTFAVGKPNKTYFTVPDGVTCTDYTTGSKSSTLFSSFNGSTLVNDPRVLEEVKREAKANGWEAVASKRFEGETFNSFKSTMNNPLSPFLMIKTPHVISPAKFKRRTLRNDITIPDTYDVRSAYPSCNTLSDILNQQSCGCCYAMAAATTFAGRMCIASKGAFDKQLSTQYIIGCDVTTLGCNGGLLQSVWNFLHENGTTTSACSSFLGVQTKCRSTCDNGSEIPIYRSEEPVDLHGDTADETVRIIQQEILEHGPVEAAYFVFEDFLYTDGLQVYQRSRKSVLAGAHAVRIIGWGNSNGKPYWLVANSWGTSWAYRGTFKISRGNNECGFEERVTAAVPILQ